MSLENRNSALEPSSNKNGLVISICSWALFAFAGISSAESLLDADAEYSATSYLESTGPGSLAYRHDMTIQQVPGMVRFQPLENSQQPTLIFRYDKGIVWAIIPEQQRYPGVKKYQEFDLGNGTGFDSHIDTLMRASAALKKPEELKNLGEESVNGYLSTHYQQRDPVPWLTDEFVVTDYWLSDSGLLIKMTTSGPDVSSTMETKDIQFGRQPEYLFAPPPGYEKAGHIINWAEEQKKLDAADEN